MSFRDDQKEYESWLRKQCKVVESDLEYKHQRIKKNPFVFLRATFFRWARRIGEICPDLAQAPVVFSVGDVHVENFGTSRDAEGRLVWGINDFDEAADIPYPYDVVRLATSAVLAPSQDPEAHEIADVILDGYRAGLAEPRPTLLDEAELWMRPLVACSDNDRVKFWKHIDECPEASLPRAAARALKQSFPPDASILRFGARLQQGGGSLGRPRFIAIASWRGGRIVREAKALVPSAWYWARAGMSSRPLLLELAHGPYRALDPHLNVRGGYVLRRLTADSRKIDFGDNDAISLKLLRAMGFDLGAIHAADHRAALIRADVGNRSPEWLHEAAKHAAIAVQADYSEWKAT